MRALVIPMASFVLAATAACGCGDDDGTSATDAGTVPRDSSVGLDASVPPDDAGARDSGGGTVDAGPAGDGGMCVDTCPAAHGVTWRCETRFMYGDNFAWSHFAGDFGGIGAWGQPGVAAASASIGDDLAQMKAAGVSVVRWWMFPRFWTESITFDAEGVPSGIGGSLVADIDEALALAEANDVYIMLTPFSFDSFTPTTTESGIFTPGLRPIVVDAARRQRLLDNLVRPVARAVEASPYKHRMIAWDMINEPEWAMTGPDMYGGNAFEPDSRLEPVTHAQMETFLSEMAVVLRAESSALVSVGSAAIKWGSAWTHLDLDFYMLHYYDWVYEYFPYDTVTLASVGLTDKPVVMGEFPTSGLSAVGGHPARSAAELANDLWGAGYGGALSWAYNDGSTWPASAVREFADMHACEAAY